MCGVESINELACNTLFGTVILKFPPALAVEGIESVLSVCVCMSVCLSVTQ